MTGRYFEWLCDQVEAPKDTHDFMEYLYDTQFMYTKAKDGNRVKDGLHLRTRYEHETGEEPDIHEDYCSVLEMMVALASRAEDILYDPPDGSHAPMIFWEMVNNMGIKRIEDGRFDYYDTNHKVRDMMGRKYTAKGKGGLFYIPGTHEDLRDMELWGQMLWYLNEYYY